MFIFEKMSLITLTTDLGYRDPYLAIVKAKLMYKLKDVQLIDLSCDIKNSSVTDVAFVLKFALKNFNENTIHLIGVKSSSNKNSNKTNDADNTRYLITKYKNQYIITPDNGLFTLLDKDFKEPVYQLYYFDKNQHKFYLNDILVDAAIHILLTGNINEIANEINDYYKVYDFEPFLNGIVLKGKKIYVDDFGNIVTNITNDIFEKYIGKKPFTIKFPGSKIQKISTNYDDVEFGQALVLFNALGNLEIAINGASAYKQLVPRDIGVNFDFNILIELDSF